LPKDYPEQRITLKDNGKVQLSPSDLERVEGEIAAIQRLKRHWREAEDTDTGSSCRRRTAHRALRCPPLLQRRGARSPHAGFDIAAARGTPVRANAQGIVLASR
jgi:murein DD-endopeptidase MepM/ murein hydrolase activator NlpD